MRSAFAVSAIIVVVSFLAVCADARPTNPELARLDNEVIALNASLITYMSRAETSIGNDVELVHASVLAAQLETVDTAAAYREAKSLIADLDALRQHAIVDLTLPSDYTPPNVPPMALAGALTNPEAVLASTDQDLATIFHDMSAVVQAASLDVQKKLESIKAKGENINIIDMFKLQMQMNYLSQLSEMSTSIMSAANSAINSMLRNLKS